MDIDYKIMFCVGIVFAVFLVKTSWRCWRNPGKIRREFIAKRFLTDNEMEFLLRLEKAAPEFRFHAQVSMGAVLDAAVTWRQDASANMRARGKFSQKIIDYVAQSRKSGEIVAVIELDDRTHDTVKDRRRDEMLNEAGYNVIRWDSSAKPQVNEIRKTLVSRLDRKTSVSLLDL